MNKAVLIGRMTKDADVRYTQGQNPMAVARFTLAVDRRFKREGEPSADFINCVAFGKTGEFIEKYGRKGLKLAIVGRWQTGNFTSKDGQKVYTNDCVVEECYFTESKNAGQGESRPQGQQQEQPSSSGSEWMNIPDGISDELPFE